MTAPAELREQLNGVSDKILIDKCAGLRPGTVSSPTASTKHSQRRLAKRFQALESEIRDHDAILDDLTRNHAPRLREGIGIGADTAAEAWRYAPSITPWPPHTWRRSATQTPPRQGTPTKR